MSIPMILAPLFVQVTLTFGLLLWLGVLRRSDFASRRVRPDEVALREPRWPSRTQQVANAFSNQFEVPVLFYVLTVLAIVTRKADLLFVVLAWAFVLSRLAHAFEHVTSNVVMRRGILYGVGVLVLAVLWIVFAVRILVLP